MSYLEDDYLVLSGIQHYCMCKRQWALIHMEMLWADNSRTVSGNLFHEKVDSMSREVRGDYVITRSIMVSSSSLGLSGKCDVVEFHKKANGYMIPGLEGIYDVIPVEYKVGHKKMHDCDRIQLCAEAIALEESLGVVISKGYLFYGKERRREEIQINDELRDKARRISDEMHVLFNSNVLPSVNRSSLCSSCSLQELCEYKMDYQKSSEEYLKRMVDET